MEPIITDIFSSAVEIVDLTFQDFGETPKEMKEALGASPWDTLELRLNRILKEGFGEHAHARVEVSKYDAQVILTVTPPGAGPEDFFLGVPHKMREILINAKENL